MPIYFIEDPNKTYSKHPAIFNNENAKLISTSNIGSTHAKLKLIDFVVGQVFIRVKSKRADLKPRLVVLGY